MKIPQTTRVAVYVERDQENNQVYIHLDPTFSSQSVQTIQANDEIAIDLDSRGRIIGMDIANASSLFPDNKEG